MTQYDPAWFPLVDAIRRTDPMTEHERHEHKAVKRRIVASMTMEAPGSWKTANGARSRNYQKSKSDITRGRSLTRAASRSPQTRGNDNA